MPRASLFHGVEGWDNPENAVAHSRWCERRQETTQDAPDAVRMMLPPPSSLPCAALVTAIARAACLIARKHDVVFTRIIRSQSSTVQSSTDGLYDAIPAWPARCPVSSRVRRLGGSYAERVRMSNQRKIGCGFCVGGPLGVGSGTWTHVCKEDI